MQMHKVLIPYFLALVVTPSTHSLEGTLMVCCLFSNFESKILMKIVKGLIVATNDRRSHVIHRICESTTEN